ncbi:Histone deacetylase 8 [Gryganskiella cystojenkinii]|nr:Histone deacetylase 8 [Gryganskiella cystojenkinii]
METDMAMDTGSQGSPTFIPKTMPHYALDSPPTSTAKVEAREESDGPTDSDILEEYGLVHDCSVFEGIGDYTEFVAGSTIQAAKLLNDDAFDIVLHWDGGRHHAQKDMAAGFCIINDIVLGIMELQKNYSRVLYLDLDVHHGDGVERAFQYTDKVLTVSLHHFADGFYPGTGSGKVSGVPARTKAAVNLPLKSGLCRATLARIFDEMIEPLVASFNPEAVVLQCGVDGMAGDPLGKWNLSLASYGDCLQKVLAWKKPLIVLGGGGYKNASAARCYAYLTSLVLGRTISDEIPEHGFFEIYEPDFLLKIEDAGRQPDENTESYLDHVKALVKQQAEGIVTLSSSSSLQSSSSLSLKR